MQMSTPESNRRKAEEIRATIFEYGRRISAGEFADGAEIMHRFGSIPGMSMQEAMWVANNLIRILQSEVDVDDQIAVLAAMMLSHASSMAANSPMRRAGVPYSGEGGPVPDVVAANGFGNYV